MVKRKPVSRIASEVRRKTGTKPKQKPAVNQPKETGLLPTGSTLLNLACSDSIAGGWPLGKISTLPGGSASGKTLVAVSSLAAACQEPRFDDYRLVFDDVERRLSFDLRYLFGDRLADRIETPPQRTSNTMEDLEANFAALSEGDRPYIYIVDSLDSLSTNEEIEKEHAKMLASAKSEAAVSKINEVFAGRKANLISLFLRRINSRIENSKSAMILTQQLRINMNAGPFGKKYRTSGGEAPYFYSHVRPMLTKATAIKKMDRKIGVKTKVSMDKNSVTGKLRDIEFEVYYDLGIDDVGSMVDFLVKEKWWKKKGQKIRAEELELEMVRAKLLRQIEKDELETAVQDIAQECWVSIEDKLRLRRKRRFK